jgi:hypothetical protein
MDIWIFARQFSLQLAVPKVSLGRFDVRANGNDWALFPDCDDQLGVNVSIPCSALKSQSRLTAADITPGEWCNPN